MKIYLLLFTLFSTIILHAQEKITLSGRITDFSGNPIDSAIVRIMDRNFKAQFITYSDRDGYYSMVVTKGNYNCIYAIKPSEYRKTKLEYWAWHVPLFDDIEINPQYQNMEIYGINVIEPQVTPYDTYIIYFRPMSLKKMITLVENQNVDKQSFANAEHAEKLIVPDEKKICNIAPEMITPKELSVKVNGIESEIVNIERVKEYARGMNYYGYLIQIKKPEEIKKHNLVYDKISIRLNSAETNETGLGEVFVKRNY